MISKFYFADHRVVEILLTQIILVLQNLVERIRIILCRITCSLNLNPLKTY